MYPAITSIKRINSNKVKHLTHTCFIIIIIYTPVERHMDAFIPLLICSFLISSVLSSAGSFQFATRLEEISSVIKSPDQLSEKFTLLNSECQKFELVRREVEPEIINEYILMQEYISKLILNCRNVKFDNTILMEFSSYLLNSLEVDSTLFSSENIWHVFGFIFATYHLNTSLRIRSILNKTIPVMSFDAKIEILKYLVRFVKTSTSFICPSLMVDDIFTGEIAETFIRKYVSKLYQTNKLDDHNLSYQFGKVTLDILSFSLSNAKVSESSYEYLLRGLYRSLSGSSSVILRDLFIGLDLTLSKVKSNLELVKLIFEITTHERIAGILDPVKDFKTFLDLMNNFTSIQNEYPQSSFLVTNEVVRRNIALCQVNSLDNTKILLCFRSFDLNENSDSSKFNFALSSSKKLGEISRSNPRAILGIENSLKLIFNFMVSLKGVLFNVDHPYHDVLCQIIATLSVIHFDLSDEDMRSQTSGFITYSMGSILLKCKFYGFDIKQILSNNLPDIFLLMDGTLEFVNDPTVPLELVHLSYYIEMVRMHSNPKLAIAFINQLCFYFIIKKPIRRGNCRDILEFFDGIDSYSGLKAGFFYFVKKYLEAPCKSDLIHFSSYFEALKSKRLLTKTEIILISKFLANS